MSWTFSSAIVRCATLGNQEELVRMQNVIVTDTNASGTVDGGPMDGSRIIIPMQRVVWIKEES